MSPQQQVPLRWITVELDGTADAIATAESLQVEDAKAIVATVPTISACVTERIHEAPLRWDTGEAFVQVCRTVPEHLELLTDAAGIKVQRGRFLSDTDAAQATAVVVLEENRAAKVFGAVDPVGGTVEIGGQTFRVIGVASGGHTSLVDGIGHEAYIPREFVLQGYLESDQDVTELDRIRVRVQSLDQIEDTRAIIRDLLDQRRPGAQFSVR